MMNNISLQVFTHYFYLSVYQINMIQPYCKYMYSFILSSFKCQMENIKGIRPQRLFKELKERQQTTGLHCPTKTTNTSLYPLSAYLHIGKILHCLAPDSPFLPLFLSAVLCNQSNTLPSAEVLWDTEMARGLSSFLRHRTFGKRHNT